MVLNGIAASWGWSLVGFPRAQYSGQFCLISLSIIWMRGTRASSVEFTDDTELGGNAELLEGGKTLQKSLDRLDLMVQGQSCEVQQGHVPGSAPGSQQPQTGLQAWGRAAGKVLSGKGQWHPGLCMP